MEIKIELIEQNDQRILYAGEYYADISDYSTNLSEMQRQIARDFANDLQEQNYNTGK